MPRIWFLILLEQLVPISSCYNWLEKPPRRSPITQICQICSNSCKMGPMWKSTFLNCKDQDTDPIVESKMGLPVDPTCHWQFPIPTPFLLHSLKSSVVALRPGFRVFPLRTGENLFRLGQNNPNNSENHFGAPQTQITPGTFPLNPHIWHLPKRNVWFASIGEIWKWTPKRFLLCNLELSGLV